MYSNSTISSRYITQEASQNPPIYSQQGSPTRQPPSPQYSPSKDPYNYTLNDQLSQKSMINKLPGHRQVQLGAHLQIVVLFQAAEIQRLSNMLVMYRGKDKNNNKEYLDRHSYQIQIKELSLILQKTNTQKQKLQKRIKQLNSMVEHFGKVNNNNNTGNTSNISKNDKNNELSILTNKYQRALLEIGKMYDDNTKLQDQVNQLTIELDKVTKSSNNVSTFYRISTQLSNVQSSPTPQQKKLKQVQSQLQAQIAQTHALQTQLSTLQSQTSHTVSQLRQQFLAELEQYKARTQQSHSLIVQEFQQKIRRYEERIRVMEGEGRDVELEKARVEGRGREYEVRVRELEGKLRNGEQQISRLNQLVTILKHKNNLLEKTNADGSLSYSISMQAGSNYNSLNNQLSVNSSFNPALKGPNTSSGMNSNFDIGSINKKNQHLQNKAAMLSQQLQRLTDIIGQKSTQIQRLQNKLSQLEIQRENDLMGVRIQFQGELSKERIKYGQLELQYDRLTRELTIYKKDLQEKQTYIQEQTNKYQQNILKTRQQQRKLCEQIYNKKIQYLQLQYGRDRSQVQQLKKTNNQLANNMQALEYETNNIRSQRRMNEIKLLQKMKEQQNKYEEKLRDIQNINRQQLQEIEYRYVQQIETLKQELKKLEIKLKAKQQQFQQNQSYRNQDVKQLSQKYDQKIRKVQDQMTSRIQQLEKVKLQLENNIRYLQEQDSQLKQAYDDKLSRLQSVIRDRDRQIRQLTQKLSYQQTQFSKQQSNSLHEIKQSVQQLHYSINGQQLQAHYSRIRTQLQQLAQQSYQAKQTIIDTIGRGNKTSVGHMEQIVGQLGDSLGHMGTRMAELGGLIRDFMAKFDGFIQATKLSEEGYSGRYIKQLQEQCSNYLQIISNKLTKPTQSNNYQSLLRQISQQIEHNNRLYKDQQQRWRQTVSKQQQTLKTYLWQREKVQIQNMTKQTANLRNEYERIRGLLDETNAHLEAQLKIKENNKRELVQVGHRWENEKRENKQLRDKIQILQQQLLAKQQIISQQSNQISQKSKQQDQQLQKLINMLQTRTKQLGQLTNMSKQYKIKYEQTKSKCQHIQKIMTKLIQQNYKDLEMIDRIQRDNVALKKEQIGLEKQLHVERMDKDRVVRECREQVRIITQELLQSNNHYHHQQQSYLIQGQQTPTLSLQHQLRSLQSLVSALRKDNYLLTKQNYNIQTSDHVSKQFAHLKLQELNKQIERIIVQNIELKDEIQRCRLELVGYVNNQVRNQEYLATFLVLFVEIQALRARLARQEKQNQVIRASNVRFS